MYWLRRVKVNGITYRNEITCRVRGMCKMINVIVCKVRGMYSSGQVHRVNRMFKV